MAQYKTYLTHLNHKPNTLVIELEDKLEISVNKKQKEKEELETKLEISVNKKQKEKKELETKLEIIVDKKRKEKKELESELKIAVDEKRKEKKELESKLKIAVDKKRKEKKEFKSKIELTINKKQKKKNDIKANLEWKIYDLDKENELTEISLEKLKREKQNLIQNFNEAIISISNRELERSKKDKELTKHIDAVKNMEEEIYSINLTKDNYRVSNQNLKKQLSKAIDNVETRRNVNNGLVVAIAITIVVIAVWSVYL